MIPKIAFFLATGLVACGGQTPGPDGQPLPAPVATAEIHDAADKRPGRERRVAEVLPGSQHSPHIPTHPHPRTPGSEPHSPRQAPVSPVPAVFFRAFHDCGFPVVAPVHCVRIKRPDR